MGLLLEYQLLYYLQIALTIWLLIDAHRRGAEAYWFWLILLLQPFGAWLYFFTVKLGDFHGMRGWFQRRVSLEELRYQANHTPTLASHLALAERLVEIHEYEEAVPYLESALAREPDHCQVLYLLAVCRTEQTQTEKALPLLDTIIRRDRCWSDYSAWRLLVQARTQLKDFPGALQACRELVRLSPTLQHRCLLGERLLEEGLNEEAQTLLEEALEDYRYAPGPLRRRNRPWAGKARQLLKRIEA